MFLPINKKELNSLGIDIPDFVVVSGDAYVDHSSFGHAIIGRLVESFGFSVSIMAQPKTDEDYLEFGCPNFAFLVTSGVVDSMVNNYTAAKKKRTNDEYSAGGKGFNRPDRALTVYCKNLRRLFPNSTIIAGGIEASLRRFAHYDYWLDTVMPSVLADAPADLIVYGMGEKPLTELLEFAKKNIPLNKIKDIRGTCYLSTFEDLSKKIKKNISGEKCESLSIGADGLRAPRLPKSRISVYVPFGNLSPVARLRRAYSFTNSCVLKSNVYKEKDYILINSLEEIKADKNKYVAAFKIQDKNTDPFNGKGIIQKQLNEKYLVVNPPQYPLNTVELDRIYALPFMYNWHPNYDKYGGVPALSEVKFSLTSHRGCFGSCAFCALNYHQGRIIQSRTQDAIIKEAEIISNLPDFKGNIHDVSGPSANFRKPACESQIKSGACKDKYCIGNSPCKNLKVDHSEYFELLKKLKSLPKIKNVFIRSGIRFDYLMMEKNDSYFKELCENYVSGQLKVAPEHCTDTVLKLMNKPPFEIYKSFVSRFKAVSKKIGKEQFIVPYFISSHPGSTLNDAIKLAEYLKSINYTPLQVQDFYPTPSTRATCMYYTGIDPDSGKKVYVAKTKEDKAMQRALLQFKKPENYELVNRALRMAGRLDLIGNGKDCLISSRFKK